MMRVFISLFVASSFSFAQAPPVTDLATRLDNAHELIIAGKVDQAITDLQAARKENPDNLRITRELGLAYYRKNQFSSAVTELKSVLSRDPNDKEAAYPFPLLSDHGLATFKAWRCFDDFENRPLHGTFLVDAHGKLQWWDIGPEPFMNVDFLIEESKRLLAIEAALASPGKSPGSPCTPAPTETQAAVQPAAQ